MKTQNRPFSSTCSRVASLMQYNRLFSVMEFSRLRLPLVRATRVLLTSCLVIGPATAELQAISVPTGTKLYLRLETPVSSRTSKAHDKLSARCVRDVLSAGGPVVPVG